MKTRIATVLSVAGVLFAGSAAALVNTQVLDGHQSSPAASVLETPSTAPTAAPAPSGATVPASAPRPTAPAPSTAATVPVATSTASSAVPATPAPPAPPVAYAVGDAGTVTLDPSTGALVVVSVAPQPGWTVVSAEPTGPTTVRVVLRSDDTEITFDAALEGAAITTAVDAQTLAPPTSSRSRSDDDHDDDDDDHDDDRGGDDD